MRRTTWAVFLLMVAACGVEPEPGGPPMTEPGLPPAPLGPSDLTVPARESLGTAYYDEAPWPFPGVGEGNLGARHTGCVFFPGRGEAPGRWLAEGRAVGPQGQLGALAVGSYPTREACEAVRARAVPKAIFYGSAGTWGSLGLDDQGKMILTPDGILARYDELCARKRAEAKLGSRMRCHADLIAVAPNGRLPNTEAVAARLISARGASVTFDFRTKGSVSFAVLLQEVKDVFAGKTSVVSRAFLEKHPIGLSLDLEPQVVDGKKTPRAADVNAMCGAYRQAMVSVGHRPEALECFVYEFGYPMVSDPANVEPWIYPVLMAFVDRARAEAELRRDGVPITPEALVDRATLIKATWTKNVAQRYSATEETGCMFTEAPYLTPTQRDLFTFAQGLEAFGDLCTVYSFQ